MGILAPLETRRLTFGQEDDDMKYGIARFVYGLASVIFIGGGVGIAIPSVEHHPLSMLEILAAIVISIFIGAIPFGLGILCLLRYRYWTKEAIRMKLNPEQGTAPLPSAPQSGPSEGAR